MTSHLLTRLRSSTGQHTGHPGEVPVLGMRGARGVRSGHLASGAWGGWLIAPSMPNVGETCSANVWSKMEEARDWLRIPLLA